MRTHVSTRTHGTVAYQPPEVLAAGRVSRAADVWAFAVLAWELVVGAKPFAGWSVGQARVGGGLGCLGWGGEGVGRLVVGEMDGNEGIRSVLSW